MAISQKTSLKLSEFEKSDQGDWARMWKKGFKVLCLKICLTLNPILSIRVRYTLPKMVGFMLWF